MKCMSIPARIFARESAQCAMPSLRIHNLLAIIRLLVRIGSALVIRHLLRQKSVDVVLQRPCGGRQRGEVRGAGGGVVGGREGRELVRKGRFRGCGGGINCGEGGHRAGIP
ncbi:hypothetical protein PMIN03_001847 [Paraphaeosphaeria minitans]